MTDCDSFGSSAVTATRYCAPATPAEIERFTPFLFELLDASHWVQSKADFHSIIDPPHLFWGEVSDKSFDTAFVDGEDLLSLNDGRLQPLQFHQTMRRLRSFLFCLTCQSRNDQCR